MKTRLQTVTQVAAYDWATEDRGQNVPSVKRRLHCLSFTVNLHKTSIGHHKLLTDAPGHHTVRSPVQPAAISFRNPVTLTSGKKQTICYKHHQSKHGTARGLYKHNPLTMLTVWLNFEGDEQGAVCKHERNSHTDVRCLK